MRAGTGRKKCMVMIMVVRLQRVTSLQPFMLSGRKMAAADKAYDWGRAAA